MFITVDQGRVQVCLCESLIQFDMLETVNMSEL